MSTMATSHDQDPVAVVMVPLPAQGHLNPLLHLSRLISTRAGLPVHFIGAETHNRQAKSRLQGWDASTIPNIHFHDVSIPPIETPPPDANSTNKLPFHLQSTLEAVVHHLPAPLAQLLSSLSVTSRRVIVIHDEQMSFAAKAASSVANGEAYCFHVCSSICYLYVLWVALGRPITENTKVLENLPRVSLDGLVPDSFLSFSIEHSQFLKLDSGHLHNTPEALEGMFNDLLDQDPFTDNKKRWAVGPLYPIVLSSAGTSKSRHCCLDWLDKQPAKSVLYVSFGTMTSFSDEQIMEYAIGLESSGQRFIWVLRDADRGNIFQGGDKENTNRQFELPEGYEERLNNRGIVVRGWAPQLDILAHGSTGGFLTHCGWNSCMESLSFGVPIATCQMQFDQPFNSLLITHILKVGVVVREWEKKEELVTSEAVKSAATTLIESSEGKEIRKRAEELGVKIRQGTMEGGATSRQLDSFLNHINRP